MKLTKTTLRQLIQEELKTIFEAHDRCSELQDEYNNSADAKAKANTLAAARDADCSWTDEIEAPAKNPLLEKGERRPSNENYQSKT